MGDVSLSFKYKYSAKVMEVDATWDIKPARAASTSMWVAIFKEGAPLTEECMCVRERVCVSLAGCVSAGIMQVQELFPIIIIVIIIVIYYTLCL